MTTVYFMRHSEALKSQNIKNSDTLQLQNEKWVLTIKGEYIAKEKSELEELKNTPKDELFRCVYIYSLAEHAIHKAILRSDFDE